jgi:hypothetical protein
MPGDDRSALASPAGDAVRDQLTTVGGPDTVAEPAASSGHHPDTEREHLDALVGAGLVSRSTGLATRRARPAIQYRPLPNPVHPVWTCLPTDPAQHRRPMTGPQTIHTRRGT